MKSVTQVTELLSEVQPKKKKNKSLEEFLHTLNKQLMAMPDGKEHDVSDNSDNHGSGVGRSLEEQTASEKVISLLKYSYHFYCIFSEVSFLVVVRGGGVSYA